MILRHDLVRRTARPGWAVLLVLVSLFGCGTEPERAPLLMSATSRALLMEGTEALQHFEFERALAFADSAEAHTPDLPDAYFLRGLVYTEMMRYEEAEAAYRKVLALHPEYRGIWNNLGNNAFRQQDYRKAIALYRKELEQNPAPLPWDGIGRAYSELGLADSARYAFEQALAVDSTFAAAHINLAQLLEEEGALEEALRHARRVHVLEPENLEARYQVGALLLKTGQAEAAMEHLRTVSEARPWHHPSLYNYGQALVRLGREEEARPHLEQAETLRAMQAAITQAEITVRGFPDDPYAHAGLGSVLRRAGRYNDALHAYRVALHLDPENLEFQNNVAVLHLLRGDHAGAIRWFENIVRQDPTFVDVWLNLGVVYARSGREADARRAWQTALQYKPDHPQARAYLARLQAGEEG